MISRLASCGLALVCVLAILFLVAFQSRSADFNSDWLLEDLTCEELVAGYNFEVEMLQQIKESYDGCITYHQGSNSPPHGGVHCALLKKEGMFVEGLANDLAAVFNAKPECTGKDK